jgi:hypothetical protein
MKAAVEGIFEKDLVRRKMKVEVPTEKYRQIGERILKYLLNDKRADYGKKILPTLSAVF